MQHMTMASTPAKRAVLTEASSAAKAGNSVVLVEVTLVTDVRDVCVVVVDISVDVEAGLVFVVTVVNVVSVVRVVNVVSVVTDVTVVNVVIEVNVVVGSP
jgi:hypothetical protein